MKTYKPDYRIRPNDRAYSFMPARVLIIAKDAARAGIIAKKLGLLQRQYIWETADRPFSSGMKIHDREYL